MEILGELTKGIVSQLREANSHLPLMLNTRTLSSQKPLLLLGDLPREPYEELVVNMLERAFYSEE